MYREFGRDLFHLLGDAQYENPYVLAKSTGKRLLNEELYIDDKGVKYYPRRNSSEKENLPMSCLA